MTIKEAFETAKKENRAAVITYFTAGFPTINSSYEVFLAMARAGADIIEIGIPFSDPLADGPSIQFSSNVALANGADTEAVFKLAKKLSSEVRIPLAFMTYYNVLLGYGLQKFCKKAHASGIQGVIIPDLPPEEAGEWLQISSKQLETVFLVSPASTLDRIKKVAKISKGFLYCVSLTGVTGVKNNLRKDTIDYVKSVRKSANLPVAVGFGISSAKQAKQFKSLADGIIVGSAFINQYREAGNLEAALVKIRKLIKNLRSI